MTLCAKYRAGKPNRLITLSRYISAGLGIIIGFQTLLAVIAGKLFPANHGAVGSQNITQTRLSHQSRPELLRFSRIQLVRFYAHYSNVRQEFEKRAVAAPMQNDDKQAQGEDDAFHNQCRSQRARLIKKIYEFRESSGCRRAHALAVVAAGTSERLPVTSSSLRDPRPRRSPETGEWKTRR
jgi:hypothetical protein